MFKKEVLNLVGYFDEENLVAGMEKKMIFHLDVLIGYRNVACDEVIVLHKENQSF
ncbi:hypothetical protein [Faecalibacillus intestinalis]|uniref:hypothetical protein n=1 Tax=Faecalibacillus intestinalis TaxID=1982626 RepID=UPI003994EE1B